jgi:hypothetical protein
MELVLLLNFSILGGMAAHDFITTRRKAKVLK